MDTKLPTSFIPKKTPTGGPSRVSGGLLGVLATIIFVFAIILSVGVYGYQKILESRIDKMQTELTNARDALQPEVIKELSRANARFVAGEDLIKRHTLISSLFKELESLTLGSVRFSKFSYVADDLGGIVIGMNGEATSYSTLALQAKIFSENTNFKNSQFGDLDLDKSGNVIFSFKSSVNPSLVSYDTYIKSLQISEPPPQPSIPVQESETPTPATSPTP